VGLDLVQFSGGEAWDDCLLANRQAIKVVRQRPAMTADDLASQIEADAALAVMLDGSRGTGVAGDWAAASEVAARLPIWLAGGLSPLNVGAAIRQVRPWAVDVSSGVETEGAKDLAKIAAFVQAAKGVAV
jgi:phosphoribosylanthranilate isomerase